MTFWTDERVEKLKRLAPNHTASQIAAIMGAPSRNAIIGKLGRIKVALNPDRPRGQAKPKIVREPMVRWNRVGAYSNGESSASAKGDNPGDGTKAAASQITAERIALSSQGVECPRQPLPMPACEPIPETGVTLADITPDACRWPLWCEATPSNQLRFCGGMVMEGLPYCAHHARIAYTGQERATLPMRSSARAETVRMEAEE